MVRTPLALALLLLPASLLTGQAPPAKAPAAPVQTVLVAAGQVAVPIEVREQYLGRSGGRTVVKFVLSVLRSDLLKTALQPRLYTFYLAGEARDASNVLVDSFRVPVDVDLTAAGNAPPRLTASFLRGLPPGAYSIVFQLQTPSGQGLSRKAIPVAVPAMSSEFVLEEAGGGPGGLPSAAAIVLEAENREKADATGGGLVRIVSPKREVPVGLLRVEADVKAPVARVEFWLDDRRLVSRNRPPYTVEVDLGKVPRKQTLKVLGFDRQGNLVDGDAWAIGDREARLTVRILDLPRRGGKGPVEVKVAVRGAGGAAPKALTLFADGKELKSWTAPPYTTSVPEQILKGATLLRATAVDEEGREYTDLKFLKGSSRFVAAAEVNAVELNVSVYDREGRFRKGLAREDFEVLEDGSPQKVGTFEFAEALPISLGIVIDGSGSMKDSLPLVKEAAREFVLKLVGEKDRGFVIEFREQPTLLAPLGKSPIPMLRAISDVRAAGGTALWDSVVLSLYQLRGVPGRKALVVLTDGQDNHSSTTYEVLRRYARTAGIPIYFIGLKLSFLEMSLKGTLRELAADTGAEAFFASNAKDLVGVYGRIETQLRAQYFMTYLTESKRPEDEFRAIEVRLRPSGLKAKTIRGYFP